MEYARRGCRGAADRLYPDAARWSEKRVQPAGRGTVPAGRVFGLEDTENSFRRVGFFGCGRFDFVLRGGRRRLALRAELGGFPQPRDVRRYGCDGGPEKAHQNSLL